MAKRFDRKWFVAGGAAAAVAAVAMASMGTGSGGVASFDGVTGAGGGSESRLAADEGMAGAAVATSAVDAFATGSPAAAGQARPEGDPQVAPLPPDLGQAAVVKTATMEVEVKEDGFAAAFSRVPTIVAAHGGFVASSSSTSGSGDDGAASGSLVVRVPADRFDALRQELLGLGEVRGQELRGTEVGGQLTDLDARLRNLASQEEAMRLLMQKTQTVGETIEVQRQLGAVREQIERLSAEQARLRDAVALSTVTISIVEPGVAIGPKGSPSPVLGAFGRAVDGAEAVVGALIVSLGYLLPLTLLGVAAWALLRSVLRGRRHGPDAAPAAS